MTVTTKMSLRDLRDTVDALCRKNDDTVPVFVECLMVDDYGTQKTYVARVSTVRQDDLCGPAITIRTETQW